MNYITIFVSHLITYDHISVTSMLLNNNCHRLYLVSSMTYVIEVKLRQQRLDDVCSSVSVYLCPVNFRQIDTGQAHQLARIYRVD